MYTCYAYAYMRVCVCVNSVIFSSRWDDDCRCAVMINGRGRFPPGKRAEKIAATPRPLSECEAFHDFGIYTVITWTRTSILLVYTVYILVYCPVSVSQRLGRRFIKAYPHVRCSCPGNYYCCCYWTAR